MIDEHVNSRARAHAMAAALAAQIDAFEKQLVGHGVAEPVARLACNFGSLLFGAFVGSAAKDMVRRRLLLTLLARKAQLAANRATDTAPEVE